MTEPSADQPIARTDDGLHSEHLQVRAIAQQIAATASVETLLPLIAEHRALLRHHFAAEEADDGLFDSIRTEAPEHEHRLVRLRQQHQDLLQDLDELCRCARGDCAHGDCAPSSSETLAQARAIADRLDHHEAEESDLLLEVFNTDLGTGE